LYLDSGYAAGNERDAADRQLLKDAGIDHVLNVTSHVPLHFDDDVTMTYRRVPASDSGCQNLKQFFDEIVAFIGQDLFVFSILLFCSLSSFLLSFSLLIFFKRSSASLV